MALAYVFVPLDFKPLDINGLISDVVVHYIARAMEESGGSKSKAAEMLGLKNYQTLTNWMEKYGVN
jgi:transcriptional regulator with PAS, ATPase and Fis domain